MTSDQALLAPRVLEGLKEFQRDTVDYVFKRMYEDSPPAHRFLVADEVGLGKTLVARGLIARAIDHLREKGVERIDVIYICSNADIAAQNIRKINVTGQAGFDLATRITLLPTRLRQLKAGSVNFVSFTPGTSFSLGDRSGRMDERALVYWLLRHAWGPEHLRHAGVFRLLRGGARADRFEGYVKGFSPRKVGQGDGRIDEQIADKFKSMLQARIAASVTAGDKPLDVRFEETADRLRRRDRSDEWNARQEIVAELRRILARSCIDALEPDLIILDEFQRFRHLLTDPTDEDDVRNLARQLFDYESDDGHARTLMLSATPYKMYTLSDESGDDDHYADFVKTTEFLIGTESAATFRGELRAYRDALLSADGHTGGTLRRRRDAVEDRLSAVMTRTERLAVKADRSGMLDPQVPVCTDVTPLDLRSFMTLDGVSRLVGAAGESIEYWKSAPYPLSFMDGYDVKRRMRATIDPVRSTAMAEMLKPGAGILDPGLIERYERLDPGNARMRALAADMLDTGGWRMLWLPPSLPYYRLRGEFKKAARSGQTKRLVFSSWNVVPQAISCVLSYEAERLMMRARLDDPLNTPDERKKLRTLLSFRRVDGRAASMTTYLLIHPSPALARLTDPLELAGPDHLGGKTPSAEAILALAETRVRTALGPAIERYGTKEGLTDDNWYWAAPMLLDRMADPAAEDSFFGRPDRDTAAAWATGSSETDRDDVEGLALHVARARTVATGDQRLGAPPDDLARVLALVGVAGPATSALRSLTRAGDDASLGLRAVRDGACRVAWGFRSLFGLPEVMALIRGRSGSEKAYWRRVLGYCLDGGLQAVLDEYGHILPEWLGLLDRPLADRTPKVAAEMYAALTIRAPLYGYDEIRVTDDAVEVEPRRLRARYALRFGVDTTDEESGVQRATQVRTAFNSPFWPFVLTTTSVGQEGLDFHQYCHAVVHWNLPANPVDLEQREGRVHRYKGHAVRRNLADTYETVAFSSAKGDPWARMFEAACKSKEAHGKAGLVPYWVFEGHGKHRIERIVPVFPMSREIERYAQLCRSLAAYRLVFGQPRQEDLVAYLSAHYSDAELQHRMGQLRINLSPPRLRSTEPTPEQ